MQLNLKRFRLTVGSVVTVASAIVEMEQVIMVELEIEKLRLKISTPAKIAVVAAIAAVFARLLWYWTG